MKLQNPLKHYKIFFSDNYVKNRVSFLSTKNRTPDFFILQKDLSAIYIYIYEDISQHQDEIPVSGIVWPEPLGQAKNKVPCTPNTVFFTTKILQYFNHYY